jgi:nuclease S1
VIPLPFALKYGVKALENETFVNLGAQYPQSPLTLVIFTKDISNFKGAIDSLYSDKNICVKGVLELYKNKPEMIVSSPAQIITQ